MSIVTKREVEATLKEELNKKHRCMKCKHYSARALFSDLPEPIIQGTCTKCDKHIIANDPYNEVPDWCPGYEAFAKTLPVEKHELEKIVLPDEEEVDGHMECISDAVKVDPTNPDHYKNSTSLECIEAMEIVLGDLGVTYFCVGNAWKYIWRWKNKNGIEDLKKAKWYIEKTWELINCESVIMPIGIVNLLTRMNDYVNRWIKESEE